MDSNIIYIPTTDLLNFNPDSIKSIAFFTSDPKKLSIIDYGMNKLTSVDLTYQGCYGRFNMSVLGINFGNKLLFYQCPS